MKRPVVQVVVRSKDGRVMREATTSAWNSGVRAGEAGVRSVARALGTRYVGGTPTVDGGKVNEVGATYRRTWEPEHARWQSMTVEVTRVA